ncbi:MAG: serine hydrolase [Bryobacteraceae bacterium]
MKPIKAVLLSFVLCAAAVAQTIDAAAIDAAVGQAMKAWQVPGAAVAIVKGDRVVHMKGYGVRQMGNPVPVTPDTLFAIASTTKAFTSTAMAMLVDSGKMQWDDPVRKYLPYFHLADPLADASVTMRDIVSHRTGLSRNDILWIGSPWSREEVIRMIGFVPLTKPFRSAYQYQNILFTAAGESVAAASGGTWEAFIQHRIFDPLGMKGANFRTVDAQSSADHSAVHQMVKGKLQTGTWSNVDNIGGAGCINAGVRDLSQWVRLQVGRGAIDGKRLVSEANLLETRTPHTVIRMEAATRALNPDTEQMTYGMGWTIFDYRGQSVVGHGGALRGFRSQVVLLPKKDIGFVILSNLGNTQMPEALRNTLIDLMLDLPAKDWNALLLAQTKKTEAEEQEKELQREAKRHKDTRPSLPLAAYAGSYQNAGYGTAEVIAASDGLLLKWSNFAPKLVHFHFDTFDVKEAGPLANTVVQFVLAPNGEVASLKMLDQEFRKLPVAASGLAK